MNSLTKYLDADNLPSISSDEMAGALYDAADDATTGSGSNVDYLSFSGKTGLYSLGRDKEDIDPDQLYLVEPQTFVSGWVCWKDSSRVDSLEWSVYKAAEQAVAREDLQDHGPYRAGMDEGWKQEIGKTTFESQGNKNFKPVFEVEVWVQRASAAAYLNGDLTEEQLVAGEAPKKKKKRKAASRKKK